MQARETEANAAMSHVTDPEGPVYAVTGLPEEVVAVLLAYTSRSSRGVREHLVQLLEEGLLGTDPLAFAQEKARAFHERWVVNYGHASVAEHATIHLVAERISRLASAELERTSPFLSFTEFSQRYQEPVRGGYVTPVELAPEEKGRYRDFMENSFSTYEELLMGLTQYHLDEGHVSPRPGEEVERTRRRARHKAFEDARYALPLAAHTSLGMTGNARALRDSISLLAQHPLQEVRELSQRLRHEASQLLPTLLRHAEPVQPPRPGLEAFPQELGEKGEGVRLLDYTGRGEPDPGSVANRTVAEVLFLMGEIRQADPKEALAHLQAYRQAAGIHPEAPYALHSVRYRMRIALSEAAWHQLLRHSRGMHLYPAPPAAHLGLTVPPYVARAGLEKVLTRLGDESTDLYQELTRRGDEGRSAGAYVLLNAHRRLAVADVDLWEMDHLVRLRLRPTAQWDIRRTVRDMALACAAVHPFLRELWGEEIYVAQPDEG